MGQRVAQRRPFYSEFTTGGTFEEARMDSDTRIAVSESEIATAIGMSVHFLRKDRRGRRLIPFYRIGDSVRYDLTRVREALRAMEEGGPPVKSKKRKSRAA